ncbi:zinc finger, PHD-type containing protein [Tanacetum coccineum]
MTPTPLSKRVIISTPMKNHMLIDHEYVNCPLRFDDRVRPANLLPIHMLDFDVILGMDWLASHRATIDCYVRTVIFGNVRQLRFFLALFMDTSLGESYIEKSYVVRVKFADVFPRLRYRYGNLLNWKELKEQVTGDVGEWLIRDPVCRIGECTVVLFGFLRLALPLYPADEIRVRSLWWTVSERQEMFWELKRRLMFAPIIDFPSGYPGGFQIYSECIARKPRPSHSRDEVTAATESQLYRVAAESSRCRLAPFNSRDQPRPQTKTKHSKSGLGLPSIVALVMTIDKSWTTISNRNSDAFLDGLFAFIKHCEPLLHPITRKICCPCSRCCNRDDNFVTLKTLEVHISSHGFDQHYTTWKYHGEPILPLPPPVPHSPEHIDMDAFFEDISANNVPTPPTQTTGPQPAQTTGPNNEFEELLSRSTQKLYPGCDMTTLEFTTEISHIKALHKITDAGFNKILALLQKACSPSKGYNFPSSYYEIKKTYKKIGLGYESIHACINDCFLFWGSEDNLKMPNCPICKASRWKDPKKTKGKKVANKVVRYFPLTPRLQRMFNTKHIAKWMTWHATGQSKENGKMNHPCDGSMEIILNVEPEFSGDPRNVRLGLAADELQELWKGVGMKDAATNTLFQMKATVLWTINDFPARSSLSGWSGQGYYACPTCNEDTPSMAVKSKIVYVGHRRFLRTKHPLRSKFKEFYVSVLSFGIKRKLGVLAFLSLKNNLDVMHIEKNALEALLNTLLQNDKSKDTIKARQDLETLRVRKELCKSDGDVNNITGMKSHDCHIMMHRLLPYGVQRYLPKNIAEPIIELCLFFKQLCARTLMQQDMAKAKKQSIRYMKKLKNYVRNKAKPEGSIAEGYVSEEALTFCSRYLKDDVETRFNRLGRNDDGLPEEEPDKFQQSLKIDTDILALPRNSPDNVKRIREKKVRDGCSEELFSLACGPTSACTYPACIVNGVKFVVHERDILHTTQCSGVSTPGLDGEMYYGQLEEIMKLTYIGHRKLIMKMMSVANVLEDYDVSTRRPRSMLRLETGNASLRKAFRENNKQPLQLGFDYADLGTFHPLGNFASMLNSLMGETIRPLPLACEWEEIPEAFKAHIYPTLESYFNLAEWYNNQDKVVVGSNVYTVGERLDMKAMQDRIKAGIIPFKTDQEILDEVVPSDNRQNMSGMGRKLPGGGSTSRRRTHRAYGDVMNRDQMTQILRQQEQEKELYRKQAEEAQQRAYLASLKADQADQRANVAYQNTESIYGALGKKRVIQMGGFADKDKQQVD